ncbi:MAG: histidine--tRNA ligase, partial [Rubrobacter sp.]|nr:histidine--tRNA ligase [Rubrobacter sp.]
MSFRGPKGTYDVFPGGGGGQEPHERPELWRWAEQTAGEFFRTHNYTEVRTPVFEEAGLFVRGAGEASDIVRKEMFVFEDKAGRELALRPEGTAGVVRSYVEHNLFKLAQPLKLWYAGPMFRHERQQRGRYRQHSQIGVEVLGSADLLVDVEVIALLYNFHRALGVREEVVYLNSLGDFETRGRYIPELRAFLEKNRSELDPDSVSRMDVNPLRTFDSKDPNTQALLDEAPSIGEFLSPEAEADFAAVREGLEALGIPYEVDERLVRGFDYYTSTIFEAKSGVLG